MHQTARSLATLRAQTTKTRILRPLFKPLGIQNKEASVHTFISGFTRGHHPKGLYPRGHFFSQGSCYTWCVLSVSCHVQHCQHCQHCLPVRRPVSHRVLPVISADQHSSSYLLCHLLGSFMWGRNCRLWLKGAWWFAGVCLSLDKGWKLLSCTEEYSFLMSLATFGFSNL